MTTDPSHPTPPPAPDERIEQLEAERLPRPAQAAAPARRNVRLAWIVALAADFLQIIAFPVFWSGAISPFDDALDVLVAALLIRLIGWHWAFLPTAVAELVPGLSMVPSWTLAVLIVTRRRPRA